MELTAIKFSGETEGSGLTDDHVTEAPTSSADNVGDGHNRARSLSISIRSIWRLSAITLLALLIGFGGWSWYQAVSQEHGAQASVEQMNIDAANTDRAEKIALDYAVGAGTMHFNDMAGWMRRLSANTGANLADRLQKAGASMEQVMVPLRWESTARPLAAKVQIAKDGVYTVLAFVNVSTKNTQAPEGIESTATYTIKIDSNSKWKIVDVGGVGGVVPGK
ncbi:hypothetical protein [Gordonia sp. MP11Mi]|uniref:Mce-associated membrane protein n=1 Tax=Gordonia sp. MP11Mi TaxID=3022769 RepID=A0AA97CZN9_9ACTN